LSNKCTPIINIFRSLMISPSMSISIYMSMTMSTAQLRFEGSPSSLSSPVWLRLASAESGTLESNQNAYRIVSYGTVWYGTARSALRHVWDSGISSYHDPINPIPFHPSLVARPLSLSPSAIMSIRLTVILISKE
jgi:hypothetical protein